MELPNDNKVFDLGGTPEEVAAVLSAAGLPTDKLALTIHPLLVKTGDRVLLFDTGAGPLFGPGSGHLLVSLSEAGIDPQSVPDIFISHSHGDHVGGLVNTEGKLNFPNAKIHLSKPEWEFMSGQEQFKDWIPVIRANVDAFRPGAELVPGVVKAVEIKGHTPGHSGYRITSGSDTLLYVGDSMRHFVISVQKPDWTIGFDGDSATATASRVALISQLATSGERIYVGAFPFPASERSRSGAMLPCGWPNEDRTLVDSRAPRPAGGLRRHFDQQLRGADKQADGGEGIAVPICGPGQRVDGADDAAIARRSDQGSSGTGSAGARPHRQGGTQEGRTTALLEEVRHLQDGREVWVLQSLGGGVAYIVSFSDPSNPKSHIKIEGPTTYSK